MPLPVDNLTKDSSPKAVSTAISESIDACMGEQAPAGVKDSAKQKYCAGKCYAIARKMTGKEKM
jgi:hypothetical protein